jgi:hypothetical protein
MNNDKQGGFGHHIRSYISIQILRISFFFMPKGETKNEFAKWLHIELTRQLAKNPDQR